MNTLLIVCRMLCLLFWLAFIWVALFDMANGFKNLQFLILLLVIGWVWFFAQLFISKKVYK